MEIFSRYREISLLSSRADRWRHGRPEVAKPRRLDPVPESFGRASDTFIGLPAAGEQFSWRPSAQDHHGRPIASLFPR